MGGGPTAPRSGSDSQTMGQPGRRRERHQQRVGSAVKPPAVAGRSDQPRLSGLAGALPARPRADHQDQRARHAQHARPGQARRARILQASTSEVYGDPEVHPQPESYWGHVNPIGPRLLRRGQALRRDAVLRLPAPVRRRHPDRAASSTPTARGCTPTTAASSPTSSCRRCTGEPITDLRRRPADAQLLLRRRPDRGFLRVHGAGRAPLPAPSTSATRRVHHPGTGRAGHRAHRLILETGVRAASGR